MRTHIAELYRVWAQCLLSRGRVVLGFSLMALSPCWDTESPPFSVSHSSPHTHTHTLAQSLHPSWIYWRDSVAIRNTGAIFIFCGGCNGKEKVSVPIVSRGSASLSFIGTNTHIDTHRGKRSQSWQGKRDTRKPQWEYMESYRPWLSKIFNVLCENLAL